MNGITLKAVDPTAEDHLVRSPDIAVILGMTAGRASARFTEWQPGSPDSGC